MKQSEQSQPTQETELVRVKLDANESPYNYPDNLYPDRTLMHLREAWGIHERIPPQCIYMCAGTEVAVDHCMRLYAMPGKDSVLSVTPTRSVYKVRARINRLCYREVPLCPSDFSLDVDALLSAIDDSVKLIFICSPNSPTGNLLGRTSLDILLDLYDGMVVIDESYIDFVPQATVLQLLNRHQNLIILRSFSHGWAAAGLRLAAMVARPQVISALAQTGYTHPVSSPVIREAEMLLARRLDIDKWTCQLVEERTKVEIALRGLPGCVDVYPSVANFLLVRFDQPEAVYSDLLREGIKVRQVGQCLRLSIGLPADNSALLSVLRRRVL